MRAAWNCLVLLAAIGSFSAPSVYALGFGRSSNQTQLGQPLDFTATVTLNAGESLLSECVAVDVASGDNTLRPDAVRMTLESTPEAHERRVRVTSTALIDEPVVTVSVSLGCGSKITRRFVAFVDPPAHDALTASAPAVSAVLSASDARIEPSAPVPNTTRTDRSAARKLAAARSVDAAASPPRRRTPAAVVLGKSNATGTSGASARNAPATAPIALSARGRQPAAPRPAGGSTTAGGPRLQLDPAAPFGTPDIAVAASAPESLPLHPLATSSPPPPGDAELMAQQRQRLQTLEDGLAKLRAQSQATQSAMAALQVQVHRAETERYAGPVVYALACLSTLLAIAVAGLWWRQPRGRPAKPWWSAAAPSASPARHPPEADTDVDVGADAQAEGLPLRATADLLLAGAIAAEEDGKLPEPPSADKPPQAALAALSAGVLAAEGALARLAPREPVHETSVEELIDLEQQAEFFIVLGQDEAAIDLLISHVRKDGGFSPLPHLKLLEIYRRRGDEQAYESIRQRFNQRFNAHAPDWDSDLQRGRTLIDYPETIARLQGIWGAPARVMETLDASLFRRNKADGTFDLPAYRELLFLYSIARDLAEHGLVRASRTVDLLLPLDDGYREAPIAHLAATTTVPGDFHMSDMMTLPLDLDVSFGSAPAVEPTALGHAKPASRSMPLPTAAGLVDFEFDQRVEFNRPGAPGSKLGS